VKVLANPIVLRILISLFAGAVAFLGGMFAIRAVRRSVQDDASLESESSSKDSFSLQTYHAVIQQLKQQKHELETLQQAERRRAKATENLSSAVLSNLSCGVLFFHTNGLVRQANPAAKEILGFASPAGMNAGELFRKATVQASSKNSIEAMTVAQAVAETIQNATAIRHIESDYVTPAGKQRFLQITVSPVHTANAEILGATCLVNDLTEIAEMRRHQELSGELSAEMALDVRNSLATISAQAKKLAVTRDAVLNEQLALDIAGQAQHLDRTIGGFLAESAVTVAGRG
jgi:PAS domain S-box-containing protein